MNLTKVLTLPFESSHGILPPVRRLCLSEVIEGTRKGEFFAFDSATLAPHRSVMVPYPKHKCRTQSRIACILNIETVPIACSALKVFTYTTSVSEGPIPDSLYTEIPPLSLSLAGVIANLAAEMIVDGVSSERSSIRLLIRTSIEFA